MRSSHSISPRRVGRMASPAAIICLIACFLQSMPAYAQPLAFARAEAASDTGARAVVSADFNRDGWADVAHANVGRNSVTILLNQHGAGLVRAVEVAVGLGPFDLATGDFNRDGIPDLAVANADGNSISILLGRGDGSFTRTDIAAPSQNPRGITTADLNRDGRPDLVYTGYATGTVQVLIGDGAGGFARGPAYTAAGTQPQGVAAGDFNHDRFPDIAVACNNGLRVLSGTSGTAVTVSTIAGHANLNVVAVGDLNGDGWVDVAAASTASSDVAVYLGGASGLAYTRSYVVGGAPRGIALADLNDDGRLDVITANRSSSTVSVLAGDRAHPGRLLAPQEFAAARGSRTLVTGDFNGDGRLDVATGNEYTAGITVLSNATAFEKAAFTFGALTLPSDTVLHDTDRIPSFRQAGFAAADFNRDGKLDLVIAGGASPDTATVVVMLRDGPSVTLAGPTPLTGFLVADFNGDGNADVLYYAADPAVGPPVTQFVTYLGDGRGHFTASAPTTEPQLRESCVAGDLNRDGRLDLVCDNLVMLGNGNGTFRPGTEFAPALPDETSPGRPHLADINRDGKLDVVFDRGVALGDGSGGLTLAQTFDTLDFSSPAFSASVAAVVDLNHDGYVDLVVGNFFDLMWVAFGSAEGFVRVDRYGVNEGNGSLVVADVNADGFPDIIANSSNDPEDAGMMVILFGSADGTFNSRDTFLQTPGPVVVADVTGDGLLDILAYDPHAVHVLVNERNDLNHAPLVPDYSVTSGNPCVTLPANSSDPDQQALTVQWFDVSGDTIQSGFGVSLGLDICVDHPGTYTYRRTADDGRGGTATGTVTFTYVVTLKEIVLYAAADNVAMTGNWARVADPTAAGGFRAHDANSGAPKVTQPSAEPADSLTIPFLADPNLTYKLWVRLKADGNSWANDSVWVQFSGAAPAPYTTGTTTGLSVSLEECLNCGVSGWGWEDDGYGAVNKNGVLLRFDPGPQSLVIQTREDGVSIDQVVLSAEKYLTTRPGTAKNDQTILPATPR
jgi:FG-GAP-like repeat/Bacterial Ig domain